jgi:hypothetical protein
MRVSRGALTSPLSSGIEEAVAEAVVGCTAHSRVISSASATSIGFCGQSSDVRFFTLRRMASTSSREGAG